MILAFEVWAGEIKDLTVFGIRRYRGVRWALTTRVSVEMDGSNKQLKN
jgi:hypothetical protein